MVTQLMRKLSQGDINME